MLGSEPISPLTGSQLRPDDALHLIQARRGQGPGYIGLTETTVDEMVEKVTRSVTITPEKVSDRTRTILSMSSTNPPHRGIAYGVAGAVVVVLGLLGAAVALAYAKWPPEAIIGVLGGIATLAVPLVGALLPKLAKIEAKVEQTAQQVDAITTQEINRAAIEAARQMREEDRP